MGLYRSLGGMVGVRLTGADIPASMDGILRAGVSCFDTVSEDPLTIRFFIPRIYLKTVRTISARKGDKLEILGKQGIYWYLRGLLTRPVLILGMLTAFLLTLFLPTKVLFVRVEGNEQIPEKRILEAAADHGIRFGASRRLIRSEGIKNALLERIPQLQWAGVTTAGCVATVHVRERELPMKSPGEEEGICSIIAAMDGVIVSATARRGNLICQPGQAVAAGDVLISAYHDVGLTVLATRAEGEVFAQTRRRHCAITPICWTVRNGETDRMRCISLILGKKRINLWKDSGISDTTCGRMYEEYYITLPGGLKLPVAIAVETVTAHSVDEKTIPQNEAVVLLQDAAQTSLCRKMVAGTILSYQHHSATGDGFCRLEGEYVCIEMIGKMQREQIGEEYVENS